MELDVLKKTIKGIKPLDKEAMVAAEERQMSLAKPPGSLGKLEEISVKIAGITGQVKNDVQKQAIVIMSADNGVCEEGVASAPQTVTRAQTINFTRRLTGVGSLAAYFDIDLLVVDMGMKYPAPDELYTENMLEDEFNITKKIVDRRLGYGTENIAKQAAMPTAEVLRALSTGIEAAGALRQAGCALVGVGEMGIGNTSTSAAVLSALTGAGPAQTVGRGGGLLDEAFLRKKAVVEQALRRGGFAKDAKLHNDAVGQEANLDCQMDIIKVLSEVGGYDITAMAGVFIGAAYYRIPVVIDGYISAVAALVAQKLFEQLRDPESEAVKLTDFMIPSHKSYEQGYEIAMDALEMEPMLLLDMRLGEGSGCPIAFKIIEAACAAMNNMATFAEAEINDDYLSEIRKNL